MDKYMVLKRHFGHSRFRQGQEQLIDAILSGHDVLGVMPTGGGKSVCYQVPALMMPGMTLVVSPLISLMKDQVASLKRAGAAAGFINSSLSGEQLKLVYERARQGAYRILYIAPERLETEGFVTLTKSMPISLVAVDEAHCISQWGQDFRPSYRKISHFIELLPRRPVVAAFTATATSEVRRDIIELLQLKDPICSITGFDRPNLFFDVRQPQKKMAYLRALIAERKEKSGIIYCATRSSVEKVCDALCSSGLAATRYHAGLSKEERQANQDDFQFDRKQIMVATNAFGMGIDKSNVGYVIHYNMPKSLEAYYQEAGRAGRDGMPADCILLFSPGDVKTAQFLIAQSGNEDLSEAERETVRKRDCERLDEMIGYCKTTRCLRGYILDYFGQRHEGSCGNCGNCNGTHQMQDMTVHAQMILSCVLRIKEKLGYHVGVTLVIKTLRGSKDQRIQQLGLDQLSTYGLMREMSQGQIRTRIDILMLEGLLRVNPLHSTLEPAGDASAVLFGKKKVFMPVRLESRPRHDESSSEASALYLALKAVRLRIAQQENVPAYVVFSNSTLADMAAKAPASMAELLNVSGVGEIKAERYGQMFLDAIAAYQQEH